MIFGVFCVKIYIENQTEREKRLMKKIFAAVLAITLAFALASCTGTVTENNITSPADGTGEKTTYTNKSVAGEYVLSQVAGPWGEGYEVKAQDYEENRLALTDDGKFTLDVKFKESSDKAEGTYEIASDGTIRLSEDAHVVSNGESIKFDGEKITVNGKLGTTGAVSFVYEKKDKKDAK